MFGKQMIALSDRFQEFAGAILVFKGREDRCMEAELFFV